ncbi:hypothetical protein KJ591_00275, partial [Patescibacteria group bacterium]|nr:hypothetical protein [Patescibacteria group bacterium]
MDAAASIILTYGWSADRRQVLSSVAGDVGDTRYKVFSFGTTGLPVRRTRIRINSLLELLPALLDTSAVNPHYSEFPDIYIISYYKNLSTLLHLFLNKKALRAKIQSVEIINGGKSDFPEL